MTVTSNSCRLPSAKKVGRKAPIVKRIAEHLGRFAILTLALTGLLALVGRSRTLGSHRRVLGR